MQLSADIPCTKQRVTNRCPKSVSLSYSKSKHANASESPPYMGKMLQQVSDSNKTILVATKSICICVTEQFVAGA